MKKAALAIGLAILFQAVAAQAGSVLFLGESGTFLYGNEVQPMDGLSVPIVENGNGNPTLDNPFLLILGIANGSAAAPTVDSMSAGYATGPTDAGSFTSGEVYSFLGLTGANNSNSFTNWSAAELAVNGITANSFEIYVYQLYNTGITGGSGVTVNFSSELPVGTFAVAYGTAPSNNGGTSVFSTPFTRSGMTVPEPSTMLLLGSGLLGLGLIRRKRNS